MAVCELDEIAMSERPIHVKMLIAGQQVSGHDQIEVRNPADPDEIVGTAPRGTARDAERGHRRGQSRSAGMGQAELCRTCQNSR